MQTKEVTVEIEGKKVVVTLKRLTYGELNRLSEEATEVKFLGNQPQIKVNQSVLKEKSILKSVTRAENELKQTIAFDINTIQNLDPADGNILYEAFLELNNPEVKKND